jgi:hypothetical protein
MPHIPVHYLVLLQRTSSFILPLWHDRPSRLKARRFQGVGVPFIEIFGRTPWTADRSTARPLPTQNTTDRQRAHVPSGIQNAIPVFER